MKTFNIDLTDEEVQTLINELSWDDTVRLGILKKLNSCYENPKKQSKQYIKYTDLCDNGHELLCVHSLSEEGVWDVYGESTYMSNILHLKTITGVLKDVINEAVMLPGFWTWGAGGKIVKKS